jgi:hypothetical protein
VSARNRRDQKKIRAIRRALRKGRLESYIDLVEWLKDRGHAQTTGEAYNLLTSGAVRTQGGHKLGRNPSGGPQGLTYTPNRIVSARLRSQLIVVKPDA